MESTNNNFSPFESISLKKFQNSKKVLFLFLFFLEIITNIDTGIFICSYKNGFKMSDISYSMIGTFSSLGRAFFPIFFTPIFNRKNRIKNYYITGIMIKSISYFFYYFIDSEIIFFGDYIFKTNVKNLFLIPRGTFPPNPSELLNSKKNKTFIDIVSKKYDIVILDGAPLTGLSDSLILSSLVDTTLIVTSMNHTPKTELLNAKKALDNVGANIAGTVANNVVAKKGSYGGYYYYYGYSANKKEDA